MRGLDLTAILAQLGRNPRQSHGAVHGFLGVTRYAYFAHEHTIFVDLELALLAKAPDFDVVRLRAGEVLQCGAEASGRHHAQVHLQPALQAHGGARLAVGEHILDLVVFHKAVHHVRCALGRRQDVEVTHGLLAAPVAAGDLDLLHVARPLQVRHQRLGVLGGDGQLEAWRLLRVRRQGVADGGLGLVAETGQLANFPVACRALELLERIDLELLVQRLHALWTEAGDFQQLGKRGRQLPV